MHPNKSIENVPISSLPDEVKDKITQALDDYKNGRYITHEQMKQKMQQWLQLAAKT